MKCIRVLWWWCAKFRNIPYSCSFFILISLIGQLACVVLDFWSHMKNALNDISVVANFATTASDGKIYRMEHFNLEMVISIGYRVKSNRGTQFRIWANQVLKDYLLKGYAVNNRMNRLEDHLESLKDKVQQIDLQIHSKLIPTQGIFLEGQVFDAYELTSRIIRSAKKSIILIDNYIDESTLLHLHPTHQVKRSTISLCSG